MVRATLQGPTQSVSQQAIMTAQQSQVSPVQQQQQQQPVQLQVSGLQGQPGQFVQVMAAQTPTMMSPPLVCFKEGYLDLGQILPEVIPTQQISYSISHQLGTVTTLWLDSDWTETFDNCRQSGDYTAIGSAVTALLAVFNSHYTITVQSQCSDCA